MWCSAVDTHLKLLDRAVSGARFLTGGVLECDISHRRSVALLCMLYKIRCNPLQPLNDALPGPYVPMRVTRGALVAHRNTYAPPRCRTSPYRMTFIPLSVSLFDNIKEYVLQTKPPERTSKQSTAIHLFIPLVNQLPLKSMLQSNSSLHVSKNNNHRYKFQNKVKFTSIRDHVSTSSLSCLRPLSYPGDAVTSGIQKQYSVLSLQQPHSTHILGVV